MASLTIALSVVSIFHGIHTGFGATTPYYPSTTAVPARVYSSQTTPSWQRATTRSYYHQTTPYWWQRSTTKSYYNQTTPYWWQRTTTRSYYPQTTPYRQRATTRSYYPTTTPYWWQRATTRSYYPQTTPYRWQRSTTPYWWQRSTTRSYYPQTTNPQTRATTRSYYPQTTPYWQRATTRSYYPQTTPYRWQRSTTPYWWQRSTTEPPYPRTTPYWWQWSTAPYPRTTPYWWQWETTPYPRTTPYWWQRSTTEPPYPRTTPYWWQWPTTYSTTSIAYVQTLLKGLQVSCEGGYFNIQYNNYYTIGYLWKNVYFGSCSMYSNYRYYSYDTKRFSFTGCGTTRTETQSHIIYSNTIYGVTSTGVITRTTDDSRLIQCKINREAVAEHSFITDNATKVYYGEGNYSVDLQFSRQQQSGYIYNYPVTIDIDDELYGQVRVTGSDRGLNPVIEDCYAKPNQTSSTLVYYLIKSRCVVDSTTKFYGNGTFSFKTFDFIQQHSTVNIICRVYVCTDDDMSYRCTRQCIRRRSVRQRRSEIDGKPISVYQGPFVVAVEDSDSIVAIATGSAVGGVVVIGFVVAFIVKVKPLLAAAKVAPAGYSSVPQSLPEVVA